MYRTKSNHEVKRLKNEVKQISKHGSIVCCIYLHSNKKIFNWKTMLSLHVVLLSLKFVQQYHSS